MLQIARQFCVVHGRVHDVDLRLHRRRLVADLSDDDSDFSHDPGHEDEAQNVHDHDEHKFIVLRRLHLIASNDEH